MFYIASSYLQTQLESSLQHLHSADDVADVLMQYCTCEQLHLQSQQSNMERDDKCRTSYPFFSRRSTNGELSTSLRLDPAMK